MDKGKTAVIYLASGNSSRFGKENKLLKYIGTKPMYRYGLDHLIEICRKHPNWEIVVVTQHEEIQRQLQEENKQNSQPKQRKKSQDRDR